MASKKICEPAWNAVKAEFKANPIQIILAVITSIPVVIASGIFLWGRSFPDPSYVEASTLRIERQVDGHFRGDLQLISTSEIRVKQATGYYIGKDFDGNFSSKRNFSIPFNESLVGQESQLRIDFEKVPEMIVLCMEVKNQRGKTSNQEIQMSVDSSKSSSEYYYLQGLFNSLPENVTKSSTCKY